MKKPQIILFDWDNTLVETGPILRKTVYSRMDALNLNRDLLINHDKPLTLEQRLQFVFGENWKAIWEDCKKDYAKILEEEGGIKILPGAIELLTQLQKDKIIIGVVSNKEKVLLEEEILALNLNDFFQVLVGSGEAKEDKPAAFPALLALKKLEEISGPLYLNLPEDCWFVGDSDLDVTCALGANLLPVIVNSKLVLARNLLQKNSLLHLDFQSLNELLSYYNKI